MISEQQRNITYRFVSDIPFKNRAPHRVRLIAPVIMGAVCVNCHNVHPESQKRDCKVGDVRGIQGTTISQAIPSNIFSFKYLLAYFILVAVVGFTFIAVQRRQATTIRGMNRELETANQFSRPFQRRSRATSHRRSTRASSVARRT